VIGGVQYALDWQIRAIESHYDTLKSEFTFASVTFFVPEHFKSESLANLRNVAVRTFRLKPGVIGRFRAIRELRLYFKSEGISLVHGHNVIDAGTLFKNNSPVSVKVLTSHGSDLARIPGLDFGARRFLVGRLAVWFALRDTDALTTVSSRMVEFGHEVIDKSRVHLIPNMPAPDSPPSRKSDRRWGIETRDLMFMTLGGARTLKGHDHLIRAFASFAGTRSDVKLVIGASGPLIDEMEQLAKSLGIGNQTIFVGDVIGEEKDALFDRADIYVNAGFFEAFGLTYLEAMAHQTAVLGSNVGGGKDIFTHKVNGFLANPYDLDSIVDGMKFLANPIRRGEIIKNATTRLLDYNPLSILRLQFGMYDRLWEKSLQG
jgi:glycosyltransferase involved in cell wall biosynthesis